MWGVKVSTTITPSQLNGNAVGVLQQVVSQAEQQLGNPQVHFQRTGMKKHLNDHGSTKTLLFLPWFTSKRYSALGEPPSSPSQYGVLGDEYPFPMLGSEKTTLEKEISSSVVSIVDIQAFQCDI